MNPDMMEYINGHKVAYVEDTHTYYVDGKPVPSVTQIVSTVLESPYLTVRPHILEQAAFNGIKLHKEIEFYEKHGIHGTSIEFHHYLKLKDAQKIRTIDTEKLVLVSYNGKIVCAGRLDMIIFSQSTKGYGIGDIKRTTRIYHDHVKLQLNLYRMGYMQSYQENITFLSCFHLRKFVYQYHRVDIDEAFAIEAIKRYQAINNE